MPEKTLTGRSAASFRGQSFLHLVEPAAHWRRLCPALPLELSCSVSLEGASFGVYRSDGHPVGCFGGMRSARQGGPQGGP